VDLPSADPETGPVEGHLPRERLGEGADVEEQVARFLDVGHGAVDQPSPHNFKNLAW
jgi:hypothetical protein